MFAGDAAKAAATPLRWQVEGVGAFDQWLGEARAGLEELVNTVRLVPVHWDRFGSGAIKKSLKKHRHPAFHAS